MAKVTKTELPAVGLPPTFFNIMYNEPSATCPFRVNELKSVATEIILLMLNVTDIVMLLIGMH
jgi:hypothetical protein